MYPESFPASLFPIADAKNHIPKIIPRYLFGDSLLTYDNPTGERHNSPSLAY